MAAINGNTGSVSIQVSGGEVFFHANKWGLDWPLEMQDITEFASVDGYKEMTPGLGKATGTASGFYQDSAGSEVALDHSDIIADGASFILTASTGRTYTFTGNILTLNLGSEIGVPTPWSCTWEAIVAPVTA